MEKSTAHKFDRIAKIYNTPLFQFYYFFVHNSCIKFLKNYTKDNSKILDVACGTGIFLKRIKKTKDGLQLFGIDNSGGMISIANKKAGAINFKVANAEKIPFEDNYFDLITVIDAFYYFQNKEVAIEELARVLKTNCYLLLFYPDFGFLPKLILKILILSSKILFFNLEEYSTFPKLKELEKIANTNHLKLVRKKNCAYAFSKLILFQKI